MTKISSFLSLLLALLVTVLACSLPTASAHATARARVFVASYGSDSNPCTFTQPCRNFQQAVNVVAASGEVTAIDSAGFGPISISHAVTITSPAGVEAGVVTTAGGTAIAISAAPADTVVLHGLTLDGAGSASIGINFTAGGRLEVIDCAVRNFNNIGIEVVSATAMSVLISNTTVTNNSSSSEAIDLVANQSGATITGTLDQVTVSHNGYGIVGYASNAQVELLISNSHIDHNAIIGVYLLGTGSSVLNTTFFKNVILNQNPIAIQLGGYTLTGLSQVTQTASNPFATVAITQTNGNSNNLVSDGTNLFAGTISVALQTWAKQ